MSKKPIQKKIIAGLDNCGKTSILLTLEGNINLMSYFTLKPTKGWDVHEIMEDDFTSSIWELGGQEQYRDQHSAKADEIFHRAKEFIYVVDVQDDKRYDVSINYLEKLLTAAKDVLSNVGISVYLHKFDPDILQKKGKDFIEKLHKNLIQKLKKVVPLEYSFTMYRTTIFTNFKKETYGFAM